MSLFKNLTPQEKESLVKIEPTDRSWYDLLKNFKSKIKWSSLSYTNLTTKRSAISLFWLLWLTTLGLYHGCQDTSSNTTKTVPTYEPTPYNTIEQEEELLLYPNNRNFTDITKEDKFPTTDSVSIPDTTMPSPGLSIYPSSSQKDFLYP
jgi:hypothetical protein